MINTGALFEVSGTSEEITPPDETVDESLDTVVDWFRNQNNLQERFGRGLRQALDEVLDGARTGRYDVKKLDKNEKTYLGTKVEIVVRAEFELPHGDRMDYKIAGHDVDAKWSIHGTWSIPREAMGHICLLMSADDKKETFDVGLVRIRPEILNNGQNQDGKKTLNALGRGEVKWLFRGAPLPRNLLLSLDRTTLDKIFTPKSGQERARELMRQVRGVLIDRNTAVTVATQLDGMRRCRGAREKLSLEGIAILGHLKDGPRIARALELPVPPKGMLLSVRLVRVPDTTTDRPTVVIDDRRFAISDSDKPTEPLPPIQYV